jgi:hypothetical protein
VGAVFCTTRQCDGCSGGIWFAFRLGSTIDHVIQLVLVRCQIPKGGEKTGEHKCEELQICISWLHINLPFRPTSLLYILKMKHLAPLVLVYRNVYDYT